MARTEYELYLRTWNHLNPPVSKWIDFPSEKQKEQTWIPTDEQRTALGMVLKHSDPDADSTKVLESLLDELTKIANPKVAKWKEKQKEQKPYEPKNWPADKDALTQEQKPTEWSEVEMKVLDSIIDDYEKAAKSFCGYDGKIGLLKAIRDGEYNLPKQEWNEEDVYITNVLEYIVGKHRPDEIFKIGNKQGVSAYKICSWLESLSKRFNLQPKQEWSKEDEMYLSQAIDTLESENYFILAEKLKSIRSHYYRDVTMTEAYKMGKEAGEASRWKPSEEEVGCLERLIAFKNPEPEDIDGCKSLLEQLTKLI